MADLLEGVPSTEPETTDPILTEPELPTEPETSDPSTERPAWLPEGFETPEQFMESHTAPDDYELTAPEGFILDESDTGISAFKATAKELGINQEGFSKLADMYFNQESARVAADWSERQNMFNESHGKTAQTTLSRVSAVLGETGATQLKAALSNGQNSQVAAMDVITGLLSKLDSEYKPASTNIPTSKSREDLQAMMTDPRYKTSQSYRDEVLKMYEQYA